MFLLLHQTIAVRLIEIFFFSISSLYHKVISANYTIIHVKFKTLTIIVLLENFDYKFEVKKKLIRFRLKWIFSHLFMLRKWILTFYLQDLCDQPSHKFLLLCDSDILNWPFIKTTREMFQYFRCKLCVFLYDLFITVTVIGTHSDYAMQFFFAAKR